MRNITKTLWLLALASVLTGCNSRPVSKPDTQGYYLEGALVKNLDTDDLNISIILKRNDTVYQNAVISVAGDTLTYVAGRYLYSYPEADDIPAGQYYLKVADPSESFADSVAFAVPQDFAIQDISGVNDDRVYRSSDIVGISFEISIGSSGYVYAVVDRNDKYENIGYAEFVTTGATSVTINKEEALEVPQNLNDTLKYHLYVYSYTGAPSTTTLLPTRFPVGLANNIDRLDFSGKFGAVIITPRDSLNAVAQ